LAQKYLSKNKKYEFDGDTKCGEEASSTLICRVFGIFPHLSPNPFFHSITVVASEKILGVKIKALTRVARWFIFKPKITIWVSFGGPWNGKC
jgi:sorbitol-specific phosphotransferase system component IIC